MLLRSGERVSDRLLAAQQGRGLARRSNFRYFVIVFGLHARFVWQHKGPPAGIEGRIRLHNLRHAAQTSLAATVPRQSP